MGLELLVMCCFWEQPKTIINIKGNLWGEEKVERLSSYKVGKEKTVISVK